MNEQLNLLTPESPSPTSGFVEIDIPVGRADIPVDTALRGDLVAALLHTKRALQLTWREHAVHRDPVSGELYRRGFILHSRRVDQDTYAVWVVADELYCDTCGVYYSVPEHLEQTTVRLRRRDPCPRGRCFGHVNAKRSEGTSAPEGSAAG